MISEQAKAWEKTLRARLGDKLDILAQAGFRANYCLNTAGGFKGFIDGPGRPLVRVYSTDAFDKAILDAVDSLDAPAADNPAEIDEAED